MSSQDLRVWYRGCAAAFQAVETGSSPVTRSKIVVTLRAVEADEWRGSTSRVPQ